MLAVVRTGIGLGLVIWLWLGLVGSYGLSHAVLALCSHYAVLVVCIASFLRNTG